MPLVWDVQPYRWLYEMRAVYTQTVIQATRNTSERFVAEATEWMKENASWTDRTERARKGLKAYVVGGKSQSKEDAGLLSSARREDRQSLSRMNQERKARMEMDRIQQGAKFKPELKRYQPRSKLPKSRSAEVAFQKEQARRFPLVEIRFQHNMRLTYALWLEVANQQRFSIIGPAMAHFTPKFMLEIKRIANLKQYRESNLVLSNTTSASEEYERHFERTSREYEIEGRAPYQSWNDYKRSEKQRRQPEYVRAKKKKEELKQEDDGDFRKTMDMMNRMDRERAFDRQQQKHNNPGSTLNLNKSTNRKR